MVHLPIGWLPSTRLLLRTHCGKGSLTGRLSRLPLPTEGVAERSWVPVAAAAAPGAGCRWVLEWPGVDVPADRPVLSGGGELVAVELEHG